MNPSQKIKLAKVFALVGMAALWLPILFMFLTAIVGSVMGRTVRFDYLMLAELWYIVLPGLALLFVASLLAGVDQKRFGWGGALAILLLAGAQLLAVVSGLASGALPNEGSAFIAVISAIIVYNIIVVALAVLSVLLVKKLFRRQPVTAITAE